MVDAVNSDPLTEASDDCCIVFCESNFKGHAQEYCLGTDQSFQDAFTLQLRQGIDDRHASIKCGKNVDATICPNGGFEIGQKPNQSDLKYICNSGSD